MEDAADPRNAAEDANPDAASPDAALGAADTEDTTELDTDTDIK